MHPLDDVSAIVEYPPDVLGIDGTCEVRVAVVSAVITCRTNTLYIVLGESEIKDGLSFNILYFSTTYNSTMNTSDNIKASPRTRL